MKHKKAKIALVYDRINKFGGAERVLKILHHIYPQAPLFTAVYHPQKAGWAADWDVRPSFLDKFPFAKSTHELYPWLTPLAFESFDFTNFDLVLSITSAEAKGVITKPQTLHVCYCLTPTRYLWHDRKTYESSIPAFIRPVIKPVFSSLLKWDQIASQRPDKYIAISKTVKNRIKSVYRRDAHLIYPPVNTNKFKKRQRSDIPLHFKKFYLTVSRLVPYKRIDLAIEASNRLKRNLIIVGTGLNMRKLRSIAGPTIYFAGKLTDEELILYYQSCDALIFPQEEDFGISVVEAQSAGKPVIAFQKGGAREIIKEGKTGIFFSEQTVDSLMEAIKKFEETSFSAQSCQQVAKQFDQQIFQELFTIKMEELWQKHKQKFL